MDPSRSNTAPPSPPRPTVKCIRDISGTEDDNEERPRAKKPAISDSKRIPSQTSNAGHSNNILHRRDRQFQDTQAALRLNRACQHTLATHAESTDMPYQSHGSRPERPPFNLPGPSRPSRVTTPHINVAPRSLRTSQH